MLRILPGIEHDLHRHALHDLDEVPGCVLRRQETEPRPGGAGDAVNLAVERAAAESVARGVPGIAGVVNDLQLGPIPLIEFPPESDADDDLKQCKEMLFQISPPYGPAAPLPCWDRLRTSS